MYLYIMKNNNRIYGNNIIVGTKDGKKLYYNWHQDRMVEDKTQATGYTISAHAKLVIREIKSVIPGYTWTTELDKPAA